MWKVSHSAVQGRSHMAFGLPCQDKTYTIHQDGCTVCALADGAGSAKLSHHGAEAVTQGVCHYLADHFDTIVHNDDGVRVKMDILGQVALLLEGLSSEMGCAPQDLASTLLFVATKGDDFVIGHLGDGVIGYVKAGKVKVATYPQNGEYANTTSFTTSIAALNEIRLIKGKLGDISGFVMMSDGTETSLYNLRTRLLSRAVLSLVKEAGRSGEAMNEPLKESLETVIRERTMDDCSLAIMARTFDTQEYLSLSAEGKAAFWEMPCTRKSAKLIAARDQLLRTMNTWRTPNVVRKQLHWHEGSFWNRFEHLRKAGLVQVKEGNLAKAA